MKANRLAAALASLLLCSATAFAAPPASSASTGSASDSAQSPETLVQKLMKPMSSTTTGTVTVEGKSISYKAVAGTKSQLGQDAMKRLARLDLPQNPESYLSIRAQMDNQGRIVTAEGNLVQPLVMSRSVHLDPLVVLIAILVGSQLLGLMGAVLAVPFAALVQSLVTHAIAPAIRAASGREEPPPKSASKPPSEAEAPLPA